MHKEKNKGGRTWMFQHRIRVTCWKIMTPRMTKLNTHTHTRHLLDLLTWHIGVLDAKWYVKPRNTCWFEEYLFNMYTPDMFYDILRMRRRTFDRLVHDLRPFIQRQHTHWRRPIGVEQENCHCTFQVHAWGVHTFGGGQGCIGEVHCT